MNKLCENPRCPVPGHLTPEANSAHNKVVADRFHRVLLQALPTCTIIATCTILSITAFTTCLLSLFLTPTYILAPLLIGVTLAIAALGIYMHKRAFLHTCWEEYKKRAQELSVIAQNAALSPTGNFFALCSRQGSYAHKEIHKMIAKQVRTNDAIPIEIADAFDEATQKQQSASAITEHILDNKMVIQRAQWPYHTVNLVFYHNCVALCNRGKRPLHSPAISIRKLKSDLRPEQLAKFIETIHHSLKDPNANMEQLYQSFEEISEYSHPCFILGVLLRAKSQHTGNCAVASPMAALRTAHALYLFANSPQTQALNMHEWKIVPPIRPIQAIAQKARRQAKEIKLAILYTLLPKAKAYFSPAEIAWCENQIAKREQKLKATTTT